MLALWLGGLLLISSNFAAGAEPAGFHQARAAQPSGEPVWTPSPAVESIAAELRESVRLQLRDEMLAALRPNSAIWRGALDGRVLAREMREDVNSEMHAEMISGLQIALSGLPTEADHPVADEETAAAEAPIERRLALGWVASRPAGHEPTR
jgi:hypothetical protein